MVQSEISKSALDLSIEEAKKVFTAHKERGDDSMAKKLIINVAASGSFIDRRHNPHIPIQTGEVAAEVRDAWNAGAAMWHVHPRNPATGQSGRMPLEQRIQIHQDWCDSVFSVAPDIITNPGGVYVNSWVQLKGPIIDEQSVLAEYRMSPLIDPLANASPNNRYVEVILSNCSCHATGGTNSLQFTNKAAIISDVKYLQARGIRVELCPYNQVDFADVKEWVLQPGIAQPPVILDTLLGLHNTLCPTTFIEACEALISYKRMLPPGVLWHVLVGGRHWLPLTVASIMLGADIVRVGMEDAVYMYPHRDNIIGGNAQVVEAVAGIARLLGREVATPAEARTVLRLPQVK